MLLGEYGADEPDQRGPVGEDSDHSVRRRISRFSRSCGLFDQIWRQIALGGAVNARMSARAASRWARDGGQFVDQSIEDPVELGVHRVGVGWSKTVCSKAFDPPQAFFGVAAIRFAA